MARRWSELENALSRKDDQRWFLSREPVSALKDALLVAPKQASVFPGFPRGILKGHRGFSISFHLDCRFLI